MPTLTVIAGQNGAGKSTLVRAYGLQTIDPDRLAHSYGQGFTTAANAQAAREALRLQAQALASRENFAIETTLAARQPLKLMAQARAAGYQVRLIFVIPEDENTRLRIDMRVQQGGHNIPDTDLERRRPRILVNLPAAIEQSDVTVFYLSNTLAGDFRVIGAAADGAVTVLPEMPGELQQVLRAHFLLAQVAELGKSHPLSAHFL